MRSLMTSNFLGAVSQRVHSPPVLLGEQRTSVLASMAKCISEMRVVTVLQILAKDPSLASEMVPMPLPGGLTRPMEFPLACLDAGLSAGYMFALQNGFDPNARLQNGGTTLLQAAIETSSPQRPMDTDICLLLACGASPAHMVSNNDLHALMAASFPAGQRPGPAAAVSMLLDAKANFSYDAGLDSPYQVLIKTGSWATEREAVRMVELMARFKRAGVDIDRETGSPRAVALHTAIMARNKYAVRGLIHLGASIDPKHFYGREVSQLLEDSGMHEIVPEVREAVMAATMSRVVNPIKPSAGSSLLDAPRVGSESSAEVTTPSAPTRGPVFRRRSL